MSRSLQLAVAFLRAAGGCRCLEVDALACIRARWKRNGWSAQPEGQSCTCECHAKALTALPPTDGGENA